jgi:glutamyl-tRNA synthetase
MSVRVRFAPSPTGRIHIGNARTALLNWLFAQKQGGSFVLRFDDTDVARSKQEYADSIEVDLAWLGIKPDVMVRQSERFALYDAAAAKLKAEGLLYPCYETAEELDRRRKRQVARGMPPVYDRAALALSVEERAKFETEGRMPHWRFKLAAKTVAWDDLVRGQSHIDCASLSDPVLVREDGTYLYTLPSVVDDIDLNVTHIIRGEDHVTNTAVQIQIFEALAGEGTAPAFGHHNLLTSASGEGLSKRSGALSLTGLRETGVESLAVSALAVLTGSSESVRPIASLAELAAISDLSQISKNAAKFDEAELHALSAKTLHHLSYSDVAARLKAISIEGEAFWMAVRGNLAHLAEARDWWNIVYGTITPVIEDADFLAIAAGLLPAEPWDATSWSALTNAVKAETGRKGKALFHPLRLALTGKDQGPEMAALLPLIGKAKASGRLSGLYA